MHRSALACAVFVVSFVTVGCGANTDAEDETSDTKVSVDVKGDQVAPKNLFCGLANVGQSLLTTSCTRYERGSYCTTREATCGAHWVGMSDGFWEFYWTYTLVSAEWIQYNDELP